MTEMAVVLSDDQLYDQLLVELQAIRTERGYNARVELISGKWEIGRAIVESPLYSKSRGGRGSDSFIKRLADDLEIGRTDCYYCVQFYEKYPRLDWDEFKEGKAISWTRIRDYYLPAHDEDEVEERAYKRRSVPMNEVMGVLRGLRRYVNRPLPLHALEAIEQRLSRSDRIASPSQ